MDDHRSADALTDAALDRDLEAALAVDPSPEFLARVRTRVQSERDASWPAWQWGLAAATGAIVVIVAVFVGFSRPDVSRMARDSSLVPVTLDDSRGPAAQDAGRVQVPLPQAPSLARPEPVEGRALGAAFSFAQNRPAKAGATSNRRRASLAEPELLISAGETRALRRLFSDVRNGLVDLSTLREGVPATAALHPPSEIAFPPITFEPIAPQSAEEGERQ